MEYLRSRKAEELIQIVSSIGGKYCGYQITFPFPHLIILFSSLFYLLYVVHVCLSHFDVLIMSVLCQYYVVLCIIV